MATLTIGLLTDTSSLSIGTTDRVLDDIAEQFEIARAEGRRGFWIAGLYERRRDDEPTHPDPEAGHQRLWIPASQPVTLNYDRPLNPDPDLIEDRSDTVYL